MRKLMTAETNILNIITGLCRYVADIFMDSVLQRND